MRYSPYVMCDKDTRVVEQILEWVVLCMKPYLAAEHSIDDGMFNED